MRLRKLSTLAVAVALAAGASSAGASLILLGSENYQGTGLGSVNTILTLQSPGNTTTETATVAVNSGTNAQIISGNALTGASQTQIRTLSQLGVTSAANLRVVLNSQEPGNAADNGIQLQNLVLTIYGTSGNVLFTSGAFTPHNFLNTYTGVGNSGLVFGLDGAQAAQAQTAAFGSGFGSNRVGLAAALSSATGGPETFFVTGPGTPTPGGPPLESPVPEPGTLALMATALGFIGAARRKTGQRRNA